MSVARSSCRPAPPRLVTPAILVPDQVTSVYMISLALPGTDYSFVQGRAWQAMNDFKSNSLDGTTLSQSQGYVPEHRRQSNYEDDEAHAYSDSFRSPARYCERKISILSAKVILEIIRSDHEGISQHIGNA